MMDQEKRIKFIEDQFNLYYRYVRESSSYLFDLHFGMYNTIDKDEEAFSKNWTQEYLFRMYNILCVYFETLGLNHYLQEFKSTYSEIIKDPEKSTEITYEILRHGDSAEDLYLILEWKKFLAPFEFFWDSEPKSESRRIIEFLECTNEILKTTKTIVTKENDINYIIKQVAGYFFNGVMAYSEGYFVHKFNHYIPDVIIKEIETAVEYKLIREDREIGTKLDELHIDAKRYSGNYNNKYCIAVFCLSQDVKKTKKEIKEEWNNMKFPKNWELIVISDVKIEKK